MGNDQSLNIVIKAFDQASTVFTRVQANAQRLGDRLRNAEEASQRFALGMTAGVAAIGGLGYAAIKAAGDMEQTKIAFETMLGSAEKADTFVKQLVSFAKTTPFELTGLNQAAKQLLAYGFAQEEVIPNLKALGDIASGVGMDKLPNLILAFGQAKAATRLTGMELRQFTEAGVPLLGMLAEQMGKTVAEIQEMVSEGKVGFPEVEKALKNLTGEGGRFNDLMAKQAKSFGGMVSNLKDSWNLFLAGEGQKLLEWAKRFVDIAIHIVTNVLPAWIDKVQVMIDFFQRHQALIYIVAGAVAGALIPAIWGAVAAFGALALTLAPFIVAGGAIAGLIAGIREGNIVITALSAGILTAFVPALAGLAVSIWTTVLPAIGALAVAFWPFFVTGVAVAGVVAGIMYLAKHWDTVKTKVQQVADKFQFLADIYKKVTSIVSKPINFVTNAASSLGGFIKGAAGFEHGGTVPGPVGRAVPIIAHGQERIISAGSSKGGDDRPLVLNFHFNGTVAGDQGIKQIITQTISDLNRQSTLRSLAGA